MGRNKNGQLVKDWLYTENGIEELYNYNPGEEYVQNLWPTNFNTR